MAYLEALDGRVLSAFGGHDVGLASGGEGAPVLEGEHFVAALVFLY